MKVFMSWSGTRSKATAELLCDWTKCVIQALRPWIQHAASTVAHSGSRRLTAN